MAPVLVPGLFRQIGQKYPSIALQTEEMLTSTILEKLRKAEVDMGIMAGPVHEDSLLQQPVWIIRDGLRQLDPAEIQEGTISYERFFEGGRVGILIQVVNDNGGITIIPEPHAKLILYSQQSCLRPIVDPVPVRTISLVIRNDYIHEAKLNALVDAVRQIIPGTLLDSVIKKGPLTL